MFLDRGWKAGATEAIELTNLLTIFLQPHDKPFDDVVYASVSKGNALNHLALAGQHSPTQPLFKVTQCWAGG